MAPQSASRFSHKQWILVAIAILLLVAAWWMFRPEKPSVKKNANEPAPAVSTVEPQPIYAGPLEGRAHPTSGRATIYRTSDGVEFLRFTNFSTSNGPDVRVVLARGDDPVLAHPIVKGRLDSVDLGPLKGDQGDQNYDLATPVDLQRYDTVVIYCGPLHSIFGLARLKPF
ncbi:MAG TPA: DM13 domain-containing protein [Terriglobales bacterium]|nr:DM13 domain-containing protein [Terriglobales bacterium]